MRLQKLWRLLRWSVAGMVIAVLPYCGGITLPDQDGDGLPDIIDPCPTNPDPTCTPTPEPPVAYDCANPPALAGLVKVNRPVKDQYIAVLKPQASATLSARSIISLASKYQVEDAKTFVKVFRGFAGKLTAAGLSRLLADPDVAYVQQVGMKKINLSWGLDRIDQRDRPGDGKFEPGADGAGVHVYINDTGVSPNSDFGSRLSPECYSTIVFRGCEDGHGHGTHVAGTAAGTKWGVAKAATIHSVRFLDENGSGTDTDAIRSLEWILGHDSGGGRKVVNASWGGEPAPAIDAAVCKIIEAGGVFVAAAGNESADSRSSTPARVVQAITVGAMDSGDAGAYFSNTGPGLDVWAPGVDIESDTPTGGTTTMSGTSMAAPHVTGAAALYFQKYAASTPAEVEAGLVELSSKDKLSGVGASPNRLLYVKWEGGGAAEGPKVVGGKWEPFLRGATNCCNYDGTPDVDEGYADGWPLVNAAALERIKGPGTVNWTHVRTGPFSSPQGPEAVEPLVSTLASAIRKYGPGPELLPDLRASLEAAKAAGIFVEVDLVDCWALATDGMNYFGDSCAVTWDAPPARYTQWVEQVVDVSWDMPVTYNLGNECFRCNPSEAWERGLYDTVKAALSAHGVNRPVGSTVKLSAPRTPFDYRTYHGFEPVPSTPTIPTMLTESDNHAHTAAEWAALAKVTEGRGGYLSVWRGPDSWDTHNAEIAALPKLDGSTPPTPPPSTKCEAGTCPNPYINAKHGSGKYGDSTMRCRDRAYCEKATGIPGTVDCALGLEGTEQRIICELEHAPGCHRWQYQDQDGKWNRCLPAPAWASCDHFNRWQEGTVYTGPCDVDPSGAPIAGWETIPRGNTYFRACGAGPTATVCSNGVKFDQ